MGAAAEQSESRENMTMQADTQTVTLPASAEDAFAFLADLTNLPRWAVGFARGIRREGDEWIVQTANGEMPIRLGADSTRGTIDFYIQHTAGARSRGGCLLAAPT
jgi:hypothetical protein